MTNAVRNHSSTPVTLLGVSLPHSQNFEIADAFIASGSKVVRHGPWPGFPAEDKEFAANMTLYKPLKDFVIPATDSDDTDDPEVKYWIALHLRKTDPKQRTASSGSIRIQYASDGQTYAVDEDNMAFDVNPDCPPAPWMTESASDGQG